MSTEIKNKTIKQLAQKLTVLENKVLEVIGFVKEIKAGLLEAQSVAEPKTQRKIQRPKTVVQKMHYSPAEILHMDDQQFYAEVVRITGVTELPIHKMGMRPIETHWMYALRKRAMKNGLYKEMPLPKTHDKQMFVNEISNPINNPAYAKLRSIHTTAEMGKEIICMRVKSIAAQSRCPRPYKYV